MAILEWKSQDNPFAQGQESSLNSAKEITASLMNGSYINGFGFNTNSVYVTPQEYYSKKQADEAFNSQMELLGRISELEQENQTIRNSRYADLQSTSRTDYPLFQPSNSSNSSGSNIGSSVANSVVNAVLYSTKPNKITHKPSNEIVAKAIEYGNRYGINPAELLAKAEIESSFNPKAGNNRYKGLFAMDYKQYGDKVYDLDFAFEHASKGIRDASNTWKKQGVNADFGHKYLLWQQGIGGAPALWKARESGMLAKDAIKRFYKDGGRSAIAGNLVKEWGLNADTVTAKQFTDAWVARGQRAYNKWDNYLKQRG